MKLRHYLDQSFYTIKLKENLYVIDAKLTYPDVERVRELGFNPHKVLIYLSKNLKISKSDINNIELLELNDEKDLRSCEYTFINGKLEVPQYKGFYYIPGFTKYAMNNKGIMININSGRKVTFNINGSYLKSTLVNDLGNIDLLAKHRALCLIFKNNIGSTDYHHVNHDDLNTLNNDFDNIYFCTPKFNTMHYHQNKVDLPMVEAICLHTGKTYTEDNIYKLSRKLDAHATTIAKYLLKSKFLPTKKGLMFRYAGDQSRNWPADDEVGGLLQFRNGFEMKVKAFNVYLKYDEVFDTIGSASRVIGIYNSTISELISKSHVVPIKGWIFRAFDEDGNYDLPVYDDVELKAIGDNQRIIKLYKLSDGMETLCFSSWTQMSKWFDVHPDTLRAQKEDTGYILKRYKVVVKELRK